MPTDPKPHAWIASIRDHAARYVGDIHNGDGMHRLFEIAIEQAVREFEEGYATRIRVCVDDMNVVQIIDNGRGLPLDF